MKILWSDHRATVSAIDEEEVYIEGLRTTKQSLKKIMQKRKKSLTNCLSEFFYIRSSLGVFAPH